MAAKNILLAIFLFVIFGCGFAQMVKRAFIENAIVPDVLPKAPNGFLKSGVRANLGNQLTPYQAREQPYISFETYPEVYYTICMTDPDVPSRKTPTNREFLHWLVVNVKGGDIRLGQVLAQYVQPAPPLGSGLHRYVLIFYPQPNKKQFDEEPIDNSTAAGRSNFSIDRFAKKHLFGDPIAGNFFQAQFDNSVPKIETQLGLTN